HFKAFIAQGHVLELAVAVVIGEAFGKTVPSLVDHITMPILGILLTGIDITNLKYRVGNVDVLYGTIIQSIFDFIIIAISILLFIRWAMKFKRKEEEKEEEEIDPKEALLTETSDILKKQNQ